MPSVCESPSERDVQRASISSWQQARIEEGGESDDKAVGSATGKNKTYEEDD